MLAPLLALWMQAQDSDLDKVLDRINAHRKTAGVEVVVNEAWLSKGCAAHAEYLVRNADHPSTKGLGLHKEDPKLPGYTPEGERAGKASVIFLGLDGPDAVEGWMASLFHRIPLLESRLRKVGYGMARGGPARVTVVLDATNGFAAARGTGPVVYPADGQKDVPLASFPEIPDPIPKDADRKAGYPVTATFPEGSLVKDAKAVLTDPSGAEVEGWLSSPERPASADYQRNTIGLIPKDPLRPATTYRVEMSARVTGKAWSRTWSFTTGGAK